MNEYETAAPFARATINEAGIHLNAWSPGLIGLGPRNRLLADISEGTLLADLSIDHAEDGNELVVHPISGDIGGPAAAKLVAWAEDAGYARVWFPDHVVTVAPTDVLVGVARVDCPTCGIEWAEASPDFLANIRRTGHFPGWCMACGGSLPEWTLDLDAQESSGEFSFTAS